MSGLLAPAEVTAMLGVSRQTLARWEKTGYLVRDPSTSRPRYRPADVTAVAEARSRDAAPAAAILRAAAELLQVRGVDGCTVDAVAERAGMTRAGVVYHHATKEQLLEALCRQFLDDFAADWQREAGRTDRGPGRLSRAYVAVTLRPATDGLGAAVLSCALDAGTVRALVSEALRGFYDRLAAEDTADGLHGAGLRACLAADGVWLLGLLHLQPLSPDRAQQALSGGLGLAPDSVEA